jgi:hypothetical protein
MGIKIRFIQFAAVLLTLISATAVFADVKIKTRSTSGGQSSESTTYIKGKRQRTEMGEQMVSIMQCDLRRSVQLAPAAKTFMVSLFDQADAAGAAAVAKTNGRTETTVVRGGTVTTIYTVKDTGERKQMFGYTARRVITTIETEPSADACSQDKTKMEMDNWVVDAEFSLVCDSMNRNGYNSPAVNGCQDKHIVRNVGAAKPGYPLYSKMTMFDENGNPKFSSTSEVIELSKVTLDAALFEVPADYREVKTPTDLYAANNRSTTAKNGAIQMPGIPGAKESAAGNSIENAGSNMPNNSGGYSTEIAAKKAGVVRLGLANVKTGSVGEGLNAQELAAAVQNTLAEYLKMPNIEIVRLEAKLPSAADAEAKEKECDFVIYANVSHKKGGGGMFGKALGKLSETVSRRAYGSSDTIGKVSQITIMTAAEASGNVKAKDQITLEIKLVAPGNSSPIAAKQFQAKAKSDGEDIITLLVEQAAQMIADAATKK